MSHSFETLPATVKSNSTAQLQTILYCGLDLNMQVKESHWTMNGREFLIIHRLFDEVAEAIEDTVDDVAERIAQLGHKPQGTLQVVSKKSTMVPYPDNISSIDEHVEVICQRMAFWTSMFIDAINNMDQNGDPISVDLLTARGRELDKLIWLVGSHLSSKG